MSASWRNSAPHHRADLSADLPYAKTFCHHYIRGRFAGLYEAGVLYEVIQANLCEPKASIRKNRPEVMVGDAVELRAVLDDRLNRSTARDLIQCTWTIRREEESPEKRSNRLKRLFDKIKTEFDAPPGSLPVDKNWNICHVFHVPGEYIVVATFQDEKREWLRREGQLVSLEVVVEAGRKPKEKAGPKLKSIIIASAPALLATAQEAITRVEWYAV